MTTKYPKYNHNKNNWFKKNFLPIHRLPIGIILLNFIILSTGQKLGFGPCPLPQAKDTLDLSRLVGRWVEAEHYPTGVNDVVGKCSSIKFVNYQNNAFFVYSQEIFKPTNHEIKKSGYAVPIYVGKYDIIYENGMRVPYWILETDYTNYVVTYTCKDYFNIFNWQQIWIYTRDRHADPDVIQNAHNAIRGRGLDPKPLIQVKQTECQDYLDMLFKK